MIAGGLARAGGIRMTGDVENEQEAYLTLAEAALLYGLSLRTLTRWVDNGWLPCVMVAGKGRLVPRNLEAIVMALGNGDG